MDFETFLTVLCEYIWYIAFVFLVGFGLWYTLRFRGLQLRSLRTMVDRTFSRNRDGEALSSFETFCISMGSRIGVGNIAGIAVAIMAGGPGAVFWMWVFAIIGSMTAFMESTMAQLFKERKSDGTFFGSPAYCAEKGLGSRKLGVLLASLTLIMFTVGFAGVDVACVTSAIMGEVSFEGDSLIIPLILSVLTFVVIIGGMGMVAKASSAIVPLMAFGWIVTAVVLLSFNLDGIAGAFGMIFEYAFTVPAAIGGGIGTVVLTGLRRGVFSNEAGLGTVSNVSGSATVKHPVDQGFVQSFGVLLDTLLFCTLTALVILSYGTFDQIVGLGLDDVQLVQYVAEQTPVGAVGSLLITVFMIVFAYTGSISAYAVSESCLRYVRDDRHLVRMLQLVFPVCMFTVGIGGVSLVFALCDVIMAVVAVVNIYIMIRLRGRIVETYADWRRQRSEGIREPEFDASVLTDCTGVSFWRRGD
ncbi:MAG: alanine:cation symporter family protein [Candidatus Methanomethylophilaceae archaeon]|nr:alanine:cation symporter family protein [Candidatus Methanomethylophilaceae archaeon]